MSSFKAEAKGPRHEFVIAAVGPAASLAIAAALFGVYYFVKGEGAPTTPLGRALTPLSVAEALLLYLWFINLALGIFNLLPAFPWMEGAYFVPSSGQLRAACRWGQRSPPEAAS